VRAAGTGGVAPQFRLVIDGEVVDTFAITTPVTNSAARQGGLVFEDFVFSYEAENGPGTVDIVYFNNGNDGADLDRDLYVDKITVNSVVLESEVDGVYTFNNGVVAGPTEFLFKNGTLAFEVPDDGPAPTMQTVVVRAAGTGGVAPQFRLVIDGEVVDTFAITTPVTNSAARQGGLVFEDFVFSYAAENGPGTVDIVYFNNGNDGADLDRDLYVDKITVNGDVLESEVDGVYTFNNGVVAGPTEFLFKNGTLSFDVPDGGPGPIIQTLEIRAAGTGGPTIAPQFEVFIGGDSFTFDAITTPVTNAERRAGNLVFETFTYEFEAATPPDSFAIRFTNNGNDPTSGEDINLYVDFITVNGQTFQAEEFGEVIRTNGVSDGSIENIDRNATMFFNDLMFA